MLNHVCLLYFQLWSLKYWLNFGVPKEKIILGLATYGLGWKLVDGSQTGVRAPADGGNTKGKYTEESGILSHYEVSSPDHKHLQLPTISVQYQLKSQVF